MYNAGLLILYHSFLSNILFILLLNAAISVTKSIYYSPKYYGIDKTVQGVIWSWSNALKCLLLPSALSWLYLVLIMTACSPDDSSYKMEMFIWNISRLSSNILYFREKIHPLFWNRLWNSLFVESTTYIYNTTHWLTIITTEYHLHRYFLRSYTY